MIVFNTLIAALFIAISASGALAQTKRVALVIGNSAYGIAPPIAAAVQDAQLMSATLRDLGFDIVEQTNLDYEQMRAAQRDFARAVTDADTVVIYYSGHDLVIDNTRYLVPVDAALDEKLSELMWNGPAEDLTLTANTQPALMACGMAAMT